MWNFNEAKDWAPINYYARTAICALTHLRIICVDHAPIKPPKTTNTQKTPSDGNHSAMIFVKNLFCLRAKKSQPNTPQVVVTKNTEGPSVRSNPKTLFVFVLHKNYC
jgi:hypothetical protein